MGADPVNEFLNLQRIFQISRRIPGDSAKKNAKDALRKLTALWGL